MRRASAALASLLALASCGDERLTTLRAAGAAGTGGTPPPGDCSAALFGYATVEDDGTKGGQVGDTVTVTTWDALKDALGRSEPLTIKIEGMLEGSAQLQVPPHKTILGLRAGSGLVGAGLIVLEGDVIIRNLVIKNVRGPGDAITLSGARHVWIDHCELSSDQEHKDDYYDGLVDIVNGSDDVTVSWTYFHDQNKTTLVGGNDDDTDDMGHLHVTYHHNRFERTTLYNPTIRFGTLHAYNNLYLNVGTGISARMGAHAVAEGNYFDMVVTPFDTTEGPMPGFILEKSPNYLGMIMKNKLTQSADVTIPYPYGVDALSDVRELVESCAGTGKIPL